MSVNKQTVREELLAKRLLSFMDRRESADVAGRYMDFRITAAGEALFSKLHALAALRLQGFVTQDRYETELEILASEINIPFDDMRVLAEGAYETRRCYYLSSRLLPIALGDWYSTEVKQ